MQQELHKNWHFDINFSSFEFICTLWATKIRAHFNHHKTYSDRNFLVTKPMSKKFWLPSLQRPNFSITNHVMTKKTSITTQLAMECIWLPSLQRSKAFRCQLCSNWMFFNHCMSLNLGCPINGGLISTIDLLKKIG